MILLQFIFIIISILMILNLLVQFKNNNLKLMQFLLWGVVWLTLLISTILVDQLSRIISFFGITRPVDLFIYFSLITLFFYMYKLNLKQEMLNHQITEIVRENTLKKGLKKRK